MSNHPSAASARHRLVGRSPSLVNWDPTRSGMIAAAHRNASVDCAWGRILFGHTYERPEDLVADLSSEAPGERDLAFYLRDPHVLLSLAPQELFLDPSHTYRLWLDRYRPAAEPHKSFEIRRIQAEDDALGIAALYRRRHLVPIDPARIPTGSEDSATTWFVAVESRTGALIGAVCTIDHRLAFGDSENGTSLWSLAVAPESSLPGVGEALVRHVSEHYRVRGAAHVDLSVLHRNEQAIALYEKLGFVRVPVFCVKRKNEVNESLYTARIDTDGLNPYARIITDEALRRGIDVDVIDPEGGLVRLRHGGRAVLCRESLTELTSAVALSIADDKRATWRLLRRHGVAVPDQIAAADPEEVAVFVRRHGRVVVKPRRGEQGRGVAVDLRAPADVEAAIERAAIPRRDLVVEEFVPGEELRVVVIGDEAVAAALRRPPVAIGTGKHTIGDLIRKLDRRRSSATEGESRVRIDDELLRCLEQAGHALDDVLAEGERLQLRRTANLHTGGTLEDATAACRPELLEAAVAVARYLELPVCGLDLKVPDLGTGTFVVIEANERPGLANHEPRPTAERFMDLLFPRSATRAGRGVE